MRGTDGRRQDQVTVGDQERLYRYYTCRRRHSFGRCPNPARVRADDIERIVDQAFRDKFLTGWKARPSVSTEELDAALAAQAEAEAELSAFLTSPATAEMRTALGDQWVEEGQRARLNRVVEAREAVTEAATPSWVSLCRPTCQRSGRTWTSRTNERS